MFNFEIEQPFGEPFSQSQRIEGEENVEEIIRPEFDSQASTVEVIETSNVINQTFL